MKTETQVSIGRVKRDISELVNRVAYGEERVILTSRGKPKAALISMEDYEILRQQRAKERAEWWDAWAKRTDALVAEILAERNGVPIDVDEVLRQDRADLEARSDWIISGH